MDLLPTFAKLAGAEIPSDRVIDGEDILPVLTENVDTPHETFFYYKGNRLEAVRSGEWKLHLGRAEGEEARPDRRGKGSSSPFAALYNLDTDKKEQVNLLGRHLEIVEKLRSYVKDFEAELDQNSRPAGFLEDAKPLTQREE